MHLHNGRADVFSRADGLSGHDVTWLFEDREGDVWVATSGGLDRFRNYAVATYSEDEGLGTPPGSGSVAADKDGTIWIGTKDGLRMWSHEEVTIYGRANDHKSQSTTVWLPVRYVANSGLRDHVPVIVFADNAGRILVSTPNAFGYMENGRFVPIRGVPGGDCFFRCPGQTRESLDREPRPRSAAIIKGRNCSANFLGQHRAQRWCAVFSG